VKVLDLWSDSANTDGTLKKDLFTPDNIHLSPAGYAAYASKLEPLLSGQGKSADAKSASTPKHLLLNYVTSTDRPKQAEEMMRSVHDTFVTANGASALQVGSSDSLPAQGSLDRSRHEIEIRPRFGKEAEYSRPLPGGHGKLAA
jgi:hypothetical protein